MTGLAAPWSVGPLSGAAGSLEVGELHEGTVPADNPFDGSLVLSIGHRNPQGLAFDRDGQLWAAEFGQNTWDELNLIEPGGNYGWPVVEGIGGDDRIRDALLGSDGRLWFLTNNTDGRGSPGAEDDRLLAVELSPAS